LKKLTELAGIGERTAARLIQHFGSEEKVLDAINSFDILALSEVEGISENRAVQLLKKALSGGESFLRTPEAASIHRRLISILQEYAHTQSAKKRMSLFQPLSFRHAEKIREIQQDLQKHIDLVKRMAPHELREIDELFRRVTPLKAGGTVHVRERAIITASREEYEAALHLREHIDVYLADSFGECLDVARGYSRLLLLGGEFAGYDFPSEVEVDVVSRFEQLKEWQIIPELELSFFASNRETLLSALKIVCVLKKYTDVFTYISEEEIAEVLQLLGSLSESGEIVREDAETLRLRKLLMELEEVVDEVEKRLHTEFSERLEQTSVTLKGEEILRAVSGGEELRHLISRGLQREYNQLSRKAVEEMLERWNLTPAELRFIEEMFPEEVEYPPRLNREQAAELKKHVLKQLTSRRFETARKLAERLYRYHRLVERLVRELISFDTLYSVACFARDCNLTMPLLTEDITLSVKGGRNLFIRGAVPVDYAIGDSPESPQAARRVILSGVNSGGKTTLLDLLAQTVVLAHMGFPVPAESAKVGLIDEFFYFGKSKGSLGAGAFEATVKSFAEVASKTRKLVLADELDTITEPGASARIISGVFEAASASSLLVFVSHLAELILEHAGCEVRVDGIEARGLDENLNLVVERTPRYNYLAKSTPQLIVERLSKKERIHKKFYQHLLSKFSE
jgi:hypothetical protein